jgi:hypothetical protein
VSVPLKYSVLSKMAAMMKGRPPTALMVIKVVTADIPYMKLRPKLSERLLSIPAECHTGEKYPLEIQHYSPSKSFPNRLRTRPRDTVSWKRIFAKSMVSRSPVVRCSIKAKPIA